MSSLKAKQPKKPPPKRTRNVGKSKRTQLSISSSTESPPSDNGEFPRTKLFPRSYSIALKDDLNMSKEQRETRGMFKNLGRADLHNLLANTSFLLTTSPFCINREGALLILRGTDVDDESGLRVSRSKILRTEGTSYQKECLGDIPMSAYESQMSPRVICAQVYE
ncbi:hypothetical protein Tco_1166206 [Tanacetum coccineum]